MTKFEQYITDNSISLGEIERRTKANGKKIDRSTLSKYKHGKLAGLTLINAKRIARALKCQIEDVF